jgi:hypothetical protein
MNRTSIVSSNLKSVGYDATSKTLEVEFANGHVWQYHNVPAETHAALHKADSAGSFFASSIRSAFKASKIHPKSK